MMVFWMYFLKEKSSCVPSLSFWSADQVHGLNIKYTVRAKSLFMFQVDVTCSFFQISELLFHLACQKLADLIMLFW